MRLRLELNFLHFLPDFGFTLPFTPCTQILWNILLADLEPWFNLEIPLHSAIVLIWVPYDFRIWVVVWVIPFRAEYFLCICLSSCGNGIVFPFNQLFCCDCIGFNFWKHWNVLTNGSWSLSSNCRSIHQVWFSFCYVFYVFGGLCNKCLGRAFRKNINCIVCISTLFFCRNEYFISFCFGDL
jgi:hypothetical protein